MVEELDGSGTSVARYAQGLGIDEPLAMYRGGLSYYYDADGLGSTTSLTDASGRIAASYTYDSFGKLTASTGTVTNPFRYTAREFDSETGLYYYRARYYDQTIGRFINEDPLRAFSGTNNFYAYVQNSPVNLTDALGLRACKDATKNCLQRALESLFPNVTSSVGDATKEIGGHWNFKVHLQFPSHDAADTFYSAYTTGATNGWPPSARFAPGPALHLENLAWNAVGSNGTYSADFTAHIDLYNPNSISNGGGGAEGLAGHAGIDGVMGHLAQAFGTNIDPANCPW